MEVATFEEMVKTGTLVEMGEISKEVDAAIERNKDRVIDPNKEGFSPGGWPLVLSR